MRAPQVRTHPEAVPKKTRNRPNKTCLARCYRHRPADVLVLPPLSPSFFFTKNTNTSKERRKTQRTGAGRNSSVSVHTLQSLDVLPTATHRLAVIPFETFRCRIEVFASAPPTQNVSNAANTSIPRLPRRDIGHTNPLLQNNLSRILLYNVCISEVRETQDGCSERKTLLIAFLFYFAQLSLVLNQLLHKANVGANNLPSTLDSHVCPV
jgi:hypothetical protein